MNKNINIMELAVDLGILVFSFFVAHYYDDIMAYRIASVPFPVLFLMISLYCLPVLIGKIYNNNFSDKEVRLKKFVLFTMITNTGFIFLYTLYYIMKKGGFGEGLQITLGVLTIVLLIMAPMAGMMFTDKNNQTKDLSAQIIVAVFTLGLFPLFIALVNGSEYFKDVNGFFQLLLILGIMLGDVFFIIILLMSIIYFRKLMIKIGAYDSLNTAFLRSLPFFTAFILVIFNIHTSRLIFDTFGGGTVLSNILLVAAFIFSGVLPLRIILAIKPPYSALNIIMGVLSVLALFISVFL